MKRHAVGGLAIASLAGLLLNARLAESQGRLWTIENVSGLCLDVRGGQAGGAANETVVQVYECNNTPAQRWRFDGGTVRNQLGRCLDVRGGQAAGAESGTPVQIYDCNGTAAQVWNFQRGGALRNALGRCLDVTGGNLTSGTAVQIYDCNGTPAQTWRRR